MGMRSRALLLEGDAVVEGLGAIAALGDEVEADTTDVFLGTEVLEVVYLVALYLEFHQAHSRADGHGRPGADGG